MSLFSYHPVGGTKPPTGAAGPSDQILRPVPAPPPPEGGGQNLPEARERGWYPVFCVPSRAPRPRRGRGQNLLEAQRKRWYPVFCVPSPCPRPRRGREHDLLRYGGGDGILVSNPLCLFHSVATKWLPKTAGNHWGRRGGKNGNFCMATKWLPRELFREKRFPFFLFSGEFSTFLPDARGVVPG